jgi:hypothetical protein
MKTIKTFGILILLDIFLFSGIFILFYDGIQGKNTFYNITDWFVETIRKIWSDKNNI